MGISGFKIYYDEVTKRFDIEDVKSLPTDVPLDSPISWNAFYDTGITAMQTMNHKLENGEIFVVKCRDCNNLFVQTKDEREWFLSNNLQIPKRCEKCRSARKNKR